MKPRLLMPLLTAVVLLAACGGSSTTSSSPSTPTPSSTSSPTPSPTETGASCSPSDMSTPSPGPDGKPAIVVTSPRPCEDVTSPVTVRGNADVFEAVVSIQILDANGKQFGALNTMASCGTGCRGTYRAKVAFFSPTRQNGTVQVFEVSAKNGQHVNVVSIPVVLVP